MVEKMMYDQRQKEVRIELIAFHVLCVCVCVWVWSGRETGCVIISLLIDGFTDV